MNTLPPLPRFRRPHARTLLDRLREPPRFLQFVTGPRQSGKTTLVRQVQHQLRRPVRYIATDLRDDAALLFRPGPGGDVRARSPSRGPAPPRDWGWLVRHWQAARDAAIASGRGGVLMVDEVQRVDDWSETVKGLWDEDRYQGTPLHVVLLGSAPLLMQQGLSESLLGRFETIDIPHWSFEEMRAAFGVGLDEYVFFGGYPGPAHLVRDMARWGSYVNRSIIEPNLERDVLAYQRVDRPALLRQVFVLGAQYSGRILSFNKMLGELRGPGHTATLARYLRLLSKAWMITGIEKLAGEAVRRRTSIPKLNVLNNALVSALSGYTLAQARADRTYWGRLVESAVGAHLLNERDPLIRVLYWRSQRGQEVDFVLQRGREIVAFEVKSGRRPGNVSGLDALDREFPTRARHVVGTHGIPLEEFLLTPPAAWFEGP